MELEQLCRITSAIRHVMECLIHNRQLLVKRLTAGVPSGTIVELAADQVESYMREMRSNFKKTENERQLVIREYWFNNKLGNALAHRQDSRLSEWGAPSGVQHQVVCRHIEVYVFRQMFI